MPRDPRRITDEHRARILELHGEGRGRNDIMRLTGLSAGTVSTVVAESGRTFDRSSIAAAAAARAADLANDKTLGAERAWDQYHRIMSRLERDEHELVVASMGEVHRVKVRDLPAQDVKALVQAAASAAATAERILDSIGGQAAPARSMLSDLAGALGLTPPAQQEHGA